MATDGARSSAGVCFFSSSAPLNGNYILDLQIAANTNCVFEIGRTLAAWRVQPQVQQTAHHPAHFWQIVSSVTFNTRSTFQGNVSSNESIRPATASRIVCGRALALPGTATLANNLVSNNCAGAMAAKRPTVSVPASALFAPLSCPSLRHCSRSLVQVLRPSPLVFAAFFKWKGRSIRGVTDLQRMQIWRQDKIFFAHK